MQHPISYPTLMPIHDVTDQHGHVVETFARMIDPRSAIYNHAISQRFHLDRLLNADSVVWPWDGTEDLWGASIAANHAFQGYEAGILLNASTEDPASDGTPFYDPVFVEFWNDFAQSRVRCMETMTACTSVSANDDGSIWTDSPL